MKLIEIQQKLRDLKMGVFTTREFQRATGLSLAGTRKFLLRYVKKGVFWQIKRGLYALREPGLPLWYVAGRLYGPSYVSLDSALSYYGMIPETVYSVISVTTRITRQFDACDTHFIYHTIQEKAYGGYRPLNRDGQTVFVAEPEKALADTLYFVHLGKKELNERLTPGRINQRRLEIYLHQYGRKNLVEWSKHVVSKKS